MSRRAAVVAAKVLAGLALLALAAWAVGLQALLDQLRRVNLLWFVAAIAAVAGSQWVSAARWVAIATILGLKAPSRELRIAYAQGMAVNVVLPGATLGGDTLRSMRLQRLGNPLGESALSVVLDRGSGLWILCLLSLCTGLGLLLSGRLEAPGLPQALAGLDVRWVSWIYLAALSAAVGLPFIPLPLARAADAGRGGARGVLGRLAELHALTVSRGGALARSLWSSLLVQILCALALWFCHLAAGGRSGYLAVQAIAAPVFIAGVVPLSYGGFGARELAALLVFPMIGVDPQTAVAAGALYGVAGILLGLATSPLLVMRGPSPAEGRTGAGGEGGS